MATFDLPSASTGVGYGAMKSFDIAARDFQHLPRQSDALRTTGSLPSPPSSSRRDSSDSHGPTNALDTNSLTTAKALGDVPVREDDILDLLSIGMGPAALAVGIAIADAYSKIPLGTRELPKVRFLEKQTQFGWHAGMQLPGAKMQISFLKDLATPRDPTSPFSFINYLHHHGRLNTFINLGTFLPARFEYEDYMKWCASHFEKSVSYGAEVQTVDPVYEDDGKTVRHFKVSWNQGNTAPKTLRARHVVIAAGGRPNFPDWCKPLTTGERPKVIHSSQYVLQQPSFNATQPHKFVVLGGGQSSAEIFSDLWDRYPESDVTWLLRAPALKPSDDSPFVNEVFDPERVSDYYDADPEHRQKAIFNDKATNYAVVRIELLEHIYHKLYMERVKQPDVTKHTRRIINNAEITSNKTLDDKTLQLSLQKTVGGLQSVPECVDATQIIVATGYLRNSHVKMLQSAKSLLSSQNAERNNFEVGRDYRVKFDESRVPESCGVWLQGCNEGTHGLSDTLLSILAIRGGEVVNSVFGKDLKAQAN